MEFNWAIQGSVAALGQEAEGLQNANCARAVIIRTGSRQEREEIISRVLVRADNRQWGGSIADLGLEASNDR